MLMDVEVSMTPLSRVNDPADDRLAVIYMAAGARLTAQ